MAKAQKRKDPDGRNLNDNEFFRKADGLYVYRYYDSFRQRKQVTAKSLKLLREKENQINEALQSNIDFSKSRTTKLNDAFDNILDLREKRGRLRPTTKANYKLMWDNCVRDTIGMKKISDIRPAMVEAFFTILTQERGFSQNTNKFIFSLLRMTFQWAVDNSIIMKSPCDYDSVRYAKASGKPKEPHKALSRNQVTALLEYMEGSVYKHYAPFVRFAIHSGMRCSEICGLCWDDVNEKTGIVSVTKQLQYKKVDGETKLMITLPKSKAGTRDVDIDQGMTQALASQKKYNFALGLMATTNVDGYEGFIFPTHSGKPSTVTGINLALKRIVDSYNTEETEKAKREHREPDYLPHLSSHDLRHTAITLMLLSGMAIADVQAKVGHENADVTMNVYNHSVKEERQRNTGLLDDFLAEAK